MLASTLSTWVIPIVRAIDAAGCDSRDLLRRAGISPELPNDPNARFPASQVARLWELATEATGDPCFGLAVAGFWHPGSMHALGYAWLASASLKEALSRVARYGRVVNSALRFRLDELEDCFRLLVLYPDKATFYPYEGMDCGFAVMITLCRASAGGEFAPLRLALCRPPPARREPFEALFRCPLEFSAERNYLDFAKHGLIELLPTGHAEMARSSDRIVQDYLARLDTADIARKIRQRLLKSLPDGELDETMVARDLHMSVRTLQRKLREEGWTFKGLVDDMRRELAISYIRDSRLSLGEITYLLGFSEPSNFTRAFRRWTGVSPHSFRTGRRPDAVAPPPAPG